MSKENLSLSKLQQYTNFELAVRIERLEDELYKKKKKPTTLGQQILLLKYLGMLDKVYELDTSTLNKAKLISLILNSDESNTKKALEAIPKDDSNLEIPFNYIFLRDTFDELAMPKLAEFANEKLKKLEDKKH